MNEFQAIDETETSFLTRQFNANHGARCRTKLAFCKLMIGILGQSGIIHIANGGQMLQPSGQFQGVCSLNPIACIERFEPKRLQIGHLWRHVGTEIIKLFDANFVVKALHCAIINNESAQRRCATADIFGRRNQLNIHT